MSTTDYVFTLNVKFIVICKPQTLNDGGEDSVHYRNRKRHGFLAAAILLFIGKIIYNLIASLSHLEALCLNVTSNALNNMLILKLKKKTKKRKSSVD